MSNSSKVAKKYTLISLLNSFDSFELKQFYAFVESNYFNKDQYALRLFSALRKKVIGQNSFTESLQLEVFKITLKEKDVQSNSLNTKQKKLLRTKMSVLTKLGKEFLMIEALKNNEVYQQALVSKKLLEKKQFSFLNRRIKLGQDFLAAHQQKSIEEYDYALQLEKDKMNSLYQSGQIYKEDNLADVNHYLDIQYLINKLGLYGTMLSIENIINGKNYDFSSMLAVEPL